MEIPAGYHQGCGTCCQQMGCPPFTPKPTSEGGRVEDGCLIDIVDEPEGFPIELLIEYRNYIKGVMAGTVPNRMARRLPCFWLNREARTCRHYRFRPEVCRGYDCGGKRRRR